MSKSNLQPKRSGVVLLVVLGMLSLFSVLVVSYVVFSSQMAEVSAAANQRRLDEIDPNGVLESALMSLVVGTNDPLSADHGHSIFEDLYGVDGLDMRVGHRRRYTPPSVAPGPNMPTTPADARGMLLRPLNGANLPQSTLFKFPTNLAEWDADGLPPTNIPTTTPVGISTNVDDAFTGRIVTFIEGPLAGVSFRIVRSFGDRLSADTTENALAGCFVIDLSQMPSEVISIDGATESLYLVAANSPNRLLYSAGTDELPGRSGIDDNNNSIVDDVGELGYRNSDDVGFRFIVNGRPFNGRGQNPSGATGIQNGVAGGSGNDNTADIELQPNARLIGAGARGGNTFPEQDERWDAADLENIFLAWQPSDHRRSEAISDTEAGGSVVLGTEQEIYKGSTGEAELHRQLGQHIIPSFHRPALINYLMNAPIRLPGEATSNRAFADLDNSDPSFRDIERLQRLILRLRRATLRPLNFEHNFFGSADLNDDGDPFDGAPGFTGSNPTPILSETIETSSAAFPALKSQVAQLATWLINGPWDVDNDNDGIPDSVWISLNMPPVQAPDGTWIRPMIAPLIEDLDGKINVNVAGNYGQLVTQFFRTNNLTAYANDADFFSTLASLGVFGAGGGVGPAEIDFSHLFNEFTPTSPAIGPVPRSQAPFFTLTPNTALNPPGILQTRYGNLLNTRYGGVPYNYLGPYPRLVFTNLPGRGNLANLEANRDQFARIPFAGRSPAHLGTSPMGRPLDLYGRSRVRKDRNGNHRFTNVAPGDYPGWGNEIVNQPYEGGMDGSLGGDEPFTPSEYADFVNGGALAGRLSQLLGDAANRNEALRNLLTTESRSIDVPEIAGQHLDLIDLFADKVTNADLQLHLDRMLGLELRKGCKLNLNRPRGNGQNDNGGSLFDETFETQSRLPAATLTNTANNRLSAEDAFPQIAGEYPAQSSINARYSTMSDAPHLPGEPNDYNGLDTNNDGLIDQGHDFDGDGVAEKIANGDELLARHLYCLMFFLIADPTSAVYVEDFPYPPNFTGDNGIRNRYAARRIAQWAANAVDYSDKNVRCTRLRYDPNPFNGFDLAVAHQNVVWGMERPEVELTENLNFHDKKLRRNLDKAMDPMDPSVTVDGEAPADEDPDPADGVDPDSDMDQFRIPEASSYVELRAVRSPVVGNGEQQPSYPSDIYTFNAGIPQLDLGRVVGVGSRRSPVFRLAVGQATGNDRRRSTRWVFDAERLGRELVANQARPEELDYLTVPAIDWTVPADVNAAVDDWETAVQHAAEVRHSLSANNEYVTIADDDFNPANDGTSDHRIRLERFVWFAKLAPDNSLDVISSAASGMRLGNVFFNREDVTDPADSDDPDNSDALLAPGQYAVVGPRQLTTLGQASTSMAPMYPYSPVDHRFEFAIQVPNAMPPQFRLNLFDFANTRQTPRYQVDDTNAFDVTSVVPITCGSLYPHEVVARQDWTDYLAATNADEIVDMGFNISAPLSGANYYTAPTHRISAAAGGNYPLVDGYRDYDAGTGLHPDVPLDHEATAPLEANGWNAVGTHQEVRTLFLQRLADPSEPWHAIDNPYLTIDFMPMDLTTFNGEHDVRQEIDRDGDGTVDEMVDNKTAWDSTTGEFAPQLKFDSRRKIPDLTRDRTTTVLLPNVSGAGNTLTAYDRVIMAKRSIMSASFNVLRDTGLAPAGPAPAFWPFSVGANWDNGNVTAAAGGLDTTYDEAQTFDRVGDVFRQSLGFVNREYGHPVRSSEPRAPSLGVGTPRDVHLLNVPWMDREFQSPIELLNVPASSRTGLLATFSPGTELQDAARREIPSDFAHLLGFYTNYANYRGADESPLVTPGPSNQNDDDATGDRAGFEKIFDVVDIGPVFADSVRWIDPTQVSMLRTDTMGTAGTFAGSRDRMFNRIVETLQPPYNYIGKHRTPGKINLNTTPDYVRRGEDYPIHTTSATTPSDLRTFSIAQRRNGFLDIGERADAPTISMTDPNRPRGVVSSSPFNSNNNGDGFSTGFLQADLYGNGSVYRALTWGISTAYELDGTYTVPSVLGETNTYDSNTGTNFGLGFKAFIESRRGYASAVGQSVRQGAPDALGPSPVVRVGINPTLDWRYPTRFAGVFAPADAAYDPTVQRFMRMESASGVGVRRRTHDMSLLRTHPDFDLRTMTPAQRAQVQTDTDTSYSIRVEEDPTPANSLPALATAPAEVVDLRMPLVNTGLLERPQAELHKDFRNLDRDSYFRFQNAARLSNLTTHHSNVFMIRMTVSYFVVDPTTGGVTGEYVSDTGEALRSKATFIVDRSIPIAFKRGLNLNASNAVIYADIQE